jgi:hypothetical protein
VDILGEKNIREVDMPAKLERCVRKVKRKGGVRSPYAVCQAALRKGKKKKGKKK